MPISNYGVLKGKATKSIKATPQKEHYQILIDEQNNPHRIAINVKSNTKPSEVLYYANDNFQHEISDVILQANLPDGFTPLISQPGGIALDFIRRNLFTIDEMVPIPARVPGDDNDLNDKFDFFVQQAIDDPSAVVFAFGQHWIDTKPDDYFQEINPSMGIHDIHMNQGNPKGKYFKDNGIWQDGGIIFHYASRNKWAAVFTAFQSQAFHTDDQTGNPLNAIPIDDNSQPENETPVRIIAAMLNPPGADPRKEYVILLNKSSQKISLNGWKILDKSKKNADTISDKMIEAGETLRINLTGKGAQLSNKGGIITLLNKEGLKVDGVSYKKQDAAHEGELVEL